MVAVGGGARRQRWAVRGSTWQLSGCVCFGKEGIWGQGGGYRIAIMQ